MAGIEVKWHLIVCLELLFGNICLGSIHGLVLIFEEIVSLQDVVDDVIDILAIHCIISIKL